MPRLGRLGFRLALAFVVVAVAAVAVLATLTILSTRREVAGLVARQQEQTSRAVTAALAQVYGEAGGWSGAALRPAYSLAAVEGAHLDVRDASGRLLAVHGFDVEETMHHLHGGAPSATLGEARSMPVQADSSPPG